MNRAASVAALESVPAKPVAEGYERWAPFYDETPNPLLAREERYLLPLIPDLHNKSVLDSACGTGRWLEKLMAQGSALGVGIDSSMAMLQVAARKKTPAARLAKATCEDLPLANGSFDFVICSFAVGHIANLESMARELARVTRLDADVFISDLHPEAYERGWRAGFRDGDTAIQIQTQRRSAEAIIEAFCSNGFNCRANVTLSLGEPEEPFFVRAGKANFFTEACRMPAVLVCHFRRVYSTAEYQA